MIAAFWFLLLHIYCVIMFGQRYEENLASNSKGRSIKMAFQRADIPFCYHTKINGFLKDTAGGNHIHKYCALLFLKFINLSVL